MILPPQKLSRKEKERRDDITGKNNIEETIDYYLSCATWSKQTEELMALYRAVEGHLDPADYKLVQNPFNRQTDDPNVSNYNALLKNYNILKGIANLLIGEFGRRSHEYVVSTITPEDEIAYKDGLAIVIRNYYSQQVANTLSEMGMQLGQQVRELPPLEEYVAKFKQKFDETRAMSGQDILDYIVVNCDLESKYIDLYWDWIITGRFFTYKKVNHDDVYFEVVPVNEMYTPIENHSRYVEDYSFAIRRQILPMFKIVDLFRGRIDDALIDAMETRAYNSFNAASETIPTGRRGYIQLPTLWANNNDSYSNPFSNLKEGIELYHVVYKTFRKFGVLTYEDQFGQITTMEVGEDYVLNKAQGDISIRWDWENEFYQGYKCLDMYIDCGPLEENRADLNQEGLQKSPYNGTVMRSSTGEVQSIIKDGLEYQRLINVAHFQMEKLMNKNKDKVTVMPYGLVPRKKGIGTKEMMYHADATSFLWVDETAPNAAMASQMIRTLDMSLGNYIKDTIELMRFIKGEYWESIGMNQQRYADISASAGKGVTEQAVIRSAIITYDLTRQFDKVIEKDYQGLLDISKLAYINGKKAKYVRTDGSIAFLKLNPDDAVNHSEASYGVFVKDAATMSEAIQSIRGQALSLIQNGGDHSLLGEIWKTNNVSRLTVIMKKMDDNKKAYEQQMEQSKQQAAQQLQDSINQNDQANRDIKKYDIDMTYQGLIESTNIKVENQPEQPTTNKEANATEQSLALHKINKENTDLALKSKDLAIKEKALTIKKNTTNK